MRMLLAVLLFMLLIPGLPAAAEDPNAGSAALELYPASIITKDGEKWGYMGVDGKFRIEPKYDLAGDFNSKGIAIVAMVPKGKSQYDSNCIVSFIDRTGKTKAGPYTSSVPSFNSSYAYDAGYAVIREKNGSKVVSEDGSIILETSNQVSSLHEGMIVFSDGNLYGHMDLKGNVLVTPKYKYSYYFADGKAPVTLTDGSYALIDTNGRVLQTSKTYIAVRKTSEGLMPYRDEKLQKYGYLTAEGGIAISPKYDEAGDFTDGFAVVNLPKEKYQRSFGLIDHEGNFVIENKYSGIHYLGQGLYSVSRDSISWQDRFTPKAIFNNKGEQLTDFKYYDAYPFKSGYSSVTSSEETFFIDPTGEEVSGLPRVKGIGTLEVKGDLIKAAIDGTLSYLKRNGETVWGKDDVTVMDGGLEIKTARCRRDVATLISYPVLRNLKNQDVQDDINSKLKQLFVTDYGESEPTEDGQYNSSLDVNFTASINKDLLIICKSGYYYPVGAAHGMPSMVYYHINSRTGNFYKLSDLFMEDSEYTDYLTSIVRKQIELNSSLKLENNPYYYFSKTPEVRADQGFVIGKDSIRVYYTPYEIAAYAAGFPSFEIPYGQILDLINGEGGFWNSFEKEIWKNKVNIIGEVSDNAAAEIKNRMLYYEAGIIDAVNKNDFSAVASNLITGSALYKDQFNLVGSLNGQNIKEKLVNYDIYAIAYEYNRKEYKVFVNERVAISYNEDEYEEKDFSWCYTMKVDEDGRIKLSNIDSWR